MAYEKTRLDDIMPSATPTEHEIRRWHTLPRDEQLERMQKTMREAIKSPLSERSMEQIKIDALKKIALSDG